MGQEKLPQKQQDALDEVNRQLESAKNAIQAYWDKYLGGREGMRKLDFYIEHNHRNPRTRQTEEIEPNINHIEIQEH